MSFDKSTIDAVWEKAEIPVQAEKNTWRKDKAGAWINRNDYGDRKSDYGWEIDHIKPLSLKGDEFDLKNLQPLQWENNESKSDNYPSYETVVSSEGNKKIKMKKSW